jgi:hypothetical protein
MYYAFHELVGAHPFIRRISFNVQMSPLIRMVGAPLPREAHNTDNSLPMMLLQHGSNK